ncbi:hypothetical protein quinque_000759 [Culex quinquefasciatus]
MKQCNWCDETADHQSGNNGGGSSSAAKNRSPTEAIAIKGEGKIKCAHHQMASPLIGTGSTSSSNNSANGTSTPNAGFLPQAPAQLVKFAAGSSAAGPGIPSGGPPPSVDSLAALNMLPAHFRDMFLAAHLLRVFPASEGVQRQVLTQKKGRETFVRSGSQGTSRYKIAIKSNQSDSGCK